MVPHPGRTLLLSSAPETLWLGFFPLSRPRSRPPQSPDPAQPKVAESGGRGILPSVLPCCESLSRGQLHRIAGRSIAEHDVGRVGGVRQGQGVTELVRHDDNVLPPGLLGRHMSFVQMPTIGHDHTVVRYAVAVRMHFSKALASGSLDLVQEIDIDRSSAIEPSPIGFFAHVERQQVRLVAIDHVILDTGERECHVARRP
jgi:hypothetical protein